MKEIPIGKAPKNVRLYIVDPQGHRLPVGAAGELWAAGPQVSRGYLNRPEKTAEVFISNPFTTEEKYSRVYRTGDIVRFLPSGDIQFVGRRDGQVKIRGFRIELKEVESIIREFPGIKDATVQAFEEEGGGKFIAAYVVSDNPVDIDALNNFIMDEKPPYMVPAVTMQIDAIPLNQNQKVNKRALPKPEKKASAATEAVNVPMNVLEEELHQLVAEIVNNTEFGVTTVLGYAGLTSISAIKLAVQVNKRYGVTLDSKSLVKTGTIQSIENEILKQMLAGGASAATTPAEKPQEAKSCVPLSYAQTGVYFECLKNPASTIYNIPYMLSYPTGTDAQKLADVVKSAIEAHPEMSVHFTTQGDTIMQTLDDSVPVEVPIIEMSEEKLSAYKQEFVRPFNLQKAPLYRSEVIKTPAGIHLLFDVHHLVFDGGSADLFIRQINSALEGQAIEKENYTYMDFVSDQQQAEQTDTFKASQQFFAEKLQTCEGASEIPADLPKTDEQGWIGEAVCPGVCDCCHFQAGGRGYADSFLAVCCHAASVLRILLQCRRGPENRARGVHAVRSEASSGGSFLPRGYCQGVLLSSCRSNSFGSQLCLQLFQQKDIPGCGGQAVIAGRPGWGFPDFGGIFQFGVMRERRLIGGGINGPARSLCDSQFRRFPCTVSIRH